MEEDNKKVDQIRSESNHTEKEECVKDAKVAKMDTSATKLNEEEAYWEYELDEDVDWELVLAVSASMPQPPKDAGPIEKFKIIEYVPSTHHYLSSPVTTSKTFLAAYNREVKILRENLPSGIWVRGYDQRLDLFSVLIAGPQSTPYEGSLFAFEIQLPEAYPKIPPLFHYISFSRNRINPNLYTEGKVCVSLLGTWEATHSSEMWNEKASSLLQVVLSIQALILVHEPYFNEPGNLKSESSTSTKNWGSYDGQASRARDYNEEVIVALLNASAEMLEKPPLPWELEITRFLKQFTPTTIERIKKWTNNDEEAKPDFSLYPIWNSDSLKTGIMALEDAVTKYCDMPITVSATLPLDLDS